MYHLVKYDSGNTYVFSESKDVDNNLTLVVEMIVSITDSRIAKKIGEAYYPPLNRDGIAHFGTKWETGDKEYIIGLAALEVL